MTHLSKDRAYPEVGDWDAPKSVRQAVVKDGEPRPEVLAPAVTQTETSTTSLRNGDIVTAIVPIETGIIPASSPESLSDDQLVEIAVGTFQRIQDSMPYIVELRKRFKAAPRGKASIGGCDTWDQFCEKHLHRTASAIRKALQAETETKPAKRESFLMGGRSPDDHEYLTLSSWLHKALRRGEERQALYCASQFDKGGYVGAAWNTIEKVVSEDIGLANPNLAAHIEVLRRNFDAMKKRDKASDKPAYRLPLTHAILMCCRSEKSRLGDHATIVGFESESKFEPPEWALEDIDKIQPPDWVFDAHTTVGRKQGKTVADFFESENKICNNPTVPDPYQGEAIQIRTQTTPLQSLSETFYVIRRKSDGAFYIDDQYSDEWYESADDDGFVKTEAFRAERFSRTDFLPDDASNLKPLRKKWEFVKVQAMYQLTAVTPTAAVREPDPFDGLDTKSEGAYDRTPQRGMQQV